MVNNSISDSGGGGNIFFTTENLAFSMPLILVCTSYAYLKYVPLNIGLPILGGIFVLYQIRSQIRAHRAKKLQSMDDKALNDLALQLEDEDAGTNGTDTKAKQLQKKKAQVQRRLAAEERKGSKKKSKDDAGDDEDDDDDALLTFAKGSREQKKKKN